jgi:rhodanese-related sulfurtransferase
VSANVPEASTAPEVTTADLAAALAAADAAGPVVVLDVRTPAEWNDGRVPGATHIPLDELGNRWEELPTDGRIYVVCAAGGRSLKAATALVGAGVDAVSVAGGTKQWAEEGRPIEC